VGEKEEERVREGAEVQGERKRKMREEEKRKKRDQGKTTGERVESVQII
jgi:hypothetical protein